MYMHALISKKSNRLHSCFILLYIYIITVYFSHNKKLIYLYVYFVTTKSKNYLENGKYVRQKNDLVILDRSL